MYDKMYDLKVRLRFQREQVELALETYSGGDDPDLQRLFDSEDYSLLGGGKRIRPFLVNEICRVLGGKFETSMPFACALEMIHTYSLIHDDLPCMDNDDLRRGKPTNHKRFGEATALLAGDALLTKAFLTASTNPYADAEAQAEAVHLLAVAAGDRGMIGGQVMDMDGEKEKLSLEKLLRLHSMKTGALIRCAAQLGCVAAGYNVYAPEVKAFVGYADKIGLVFQVVDDILDQVGSEAELGKRVGGDATNHKTTFLSYYSVEEAKKYAAKLTEEAIAEISSIPGTEVLSELAEYLLERNH